jgi:hypothetical protein
MIELELTEVIWHYAIGTDGKRRYVVKQKKNGACINDQTGGMGEYTVYVEEYFINTWHIVDHTIRGGFASFENALHDVKEKLRAWH